MTTEQAAALASGITAAAKNQWVQLRRRRLQCHGGTVMPSGTVQKPLPAYLAEFCTWLHNRGVFATSESNPAPNHCLINEYEPGQGIMPHQDGPLYHPTVAILSLGSHTVFNFWPSAAAAADPAARPARSLLLEPRSLLVFRGDAYNEYLHGIAERHFDTPADWLETPPESEGEITHGVSVDGARERGTRLSLTVRHVLNML